VKTCGKTRQEESSVRKKQRKIINKQHRSENNRQRKIIKMAKLKNISDLIVKKKKYRKIESMKYQRAKKAGRAGMARNKYRKASEYGGISESGNKGSMARMAK